MCMFVKEYIDITEEEKKFINELRPLFNSKDSETVFLGVKMFKASKLWKRMKTRTLWYHVGNNLNIEQSMIRTCCYNVAAGLTSCNGRYYVHYVFIDKLLKNQYFYRWYKD